MDTLSPNGPSPTVPDRAALREMLLFYADAGVDEALLDVPADRFAEVVARMPPPARAEPPRAQPTPPKAEPARPMATMAVPDDAQAARARELAKEAKNLSELREILAGFEGCNLKFTAKQTVFADGNPEADLMLVGEAPGRDEDIEGRPFVGRSGQLLNRMMAAIGLDRGSAYIANIIPWRPPGNRDPSPIETQICLPFIKRHIELVDPDVLVCLGKPSTQTLLNVTDGIVRTRGRWFDYETGSRVIGAMPTFHPAYLLRQSVSKRQSWQDFRAVARWLAESAGRPHP